MDAGQEDRNMKIEKNPTSIDQPPNPPPNPSSIFYLPASNQN
jgi:hypothetical protein